MDLSKLKVAGFQMFTTADIDRNLRKITDAIQTAAANGADVLALPEGAISGYGPMHYESISQIDCKRIAEANSEIAKLCREHGLWLIGGTMVERGEELFNTALIISPDGKVAGEYDKVHLTGEDKKWFAPGQSVSVFDFGGALFGVQICFDVRFPEPYRYLKSLGATVVFGIFNACGGATWKIPVLEGAYRTRAAENSMYMVAVNAAGPLQMAVSRICDPRGLSLAEANQDAEEIIYATLDLTKVGEGFFGERRADAFEVVYKL
ncbi:MAG: carbon-nitrogen hydrolase family protein [Armatimonadota bacterium]|nr:carbon-nitrogen hydrolase family protein [Armatimonadota bacterium]